MPDGILIVNKPAGWTASESGLVEHSAAARPCFSLRLVPPFPRQTRGAGLCRGEQGGLECLMEF